MTKALATQNKELAPGPLQSVPAVVANNSVEAIIEKAIVSGSDITVLEKLLAMRDGLRKEEAKRLFDEAMAEFQSECPIIVKEKKVAFESKRTGQKTNYSYAPLEVIVEQVKVPLKNHGFSYRITAEITADSWVVATCHVTHKGGHTETSTFKVPIDKEAYMNEQQKVASALTYAKRYAFNNAFGIMTGDEDDDSNANPPRQDTKEKAAAPSTPAPAAEKKSNETKPLAPKDFPPDNTIVGKVEEIGKKATARKDSFRYRIKIEGNDYFTFDTKISDVAMKAYEGKSFVAIHWEKGQYGKDIKTIAQVS